MGTLLEKVGQRLKANKAYAEHSGRVERAKRLGRKLRGYYGASDQDDRSRVVVEGVAAFTYQSRPLYHFRRPQISVDARTPKYVTDRLSPDGSEQTLNNTRNAMVAEIALNQELRRIEIEDEINQVVQDAICPFEVGMLKIGYENKTQFGDSRAVNVNDRVWAMRTNPMDVFPAWDARNRKTLGDYFHRIYKPVQWVKDNKDFSKKGRAKVSATRTPEFLTERLGGNAAGTPYDTTALYEYHDIENNQIGLLTDNGEEWLLEPYTFPYFYDGPQFVFFVPYPLNDDFYGRCPAHMIEPQIDETQDYRARMLTLFKRWPVLLHGKTGAMSAEQLRKWRDAEDAEYFESDGQVEIVTMPQIPQSFFGVQEMIERDLEKTGGTSAMRRGEVTAVKPTTAQIIEGHGNLRDADIREEVAKVYNRSAEKVLDLMMQFYTAPRWVKLTGAKYQPEHLGTMRIEETAQGPFGLYTNSDIAGQYDFATDVSSLVPVNNELRAKVLTETLQMIPSLPPEVQKKFMMKYNIEDVVAEIVRMQGVNLEKYAADEEAEGPEQADPIAENEHILQGGILAHPDAEEPHQAHRAMHAPVLGQLGQNPTDPRYLRLKDHDEVHAAYEAQAMAKQGIQPGQPMMGQGQMQGGVQPMGQSGMPMPQAAPLTPVRPTMPSMGRRGMNGGGM